jgi:ATP-dependent Clp protease ATP-binding subunit ClpB
VREAVLGDLRSYFKPEFLNRLDDVILFKPLQLDQIFKIVDLLMADLNGRLSDRRIAVTLTMAAREWLAKKGYDPIYGARPLRRLIQREVENKLARAIVSGKLLEGHGAVVDCQGDALALVEH